MDEHFLVGNALGRRALLGALSLAVLLPLAVRPAGAAVSAEAAQGVIQKVGDQVILILQDASLSDRQKFDRLVALLDGPIDLYLVARLILGRYWRTASDAQRTQYLELFHAYALDFLASKLHLYHGQSYEVLSATVIDERDVLVNTRILSADRPPLKVDWRMRQLDDGSLVAIDVIVEGVSLVVTQRSEFGSVIERQGFDGLLAELRQRIEREA